MIQNLTLNRKLVTKILTNVVAPTYKIHLSHILQNQFFAVSIDETTDRTVKQSMCIVVRYIDEEKKRINDSLFELLNICDGDEYRKSDAKTLLNKLINALEEAGIPLYRFFIFIFDTCSVMTGCYKGVGQRLIEKIPGIKITKCLCHIQSLCAHDAIKKLPQIFDVIPN